MRKHKSTSFSNLILVSGPSRGGKSAWAEKLISDQDSVTYLSTLIVDDTDLELKERIAIHKKRRPDKWHLIETSGNLPQAINSISTQTSLLIDSLGGYVSLNISKDDIQWEKESCKFLQSIQKYKQLIVIVIEETGWGLTPTTTIGRIFSNRLGLLSQDLQKISTDSWLVIQGMAVNLKDLGICINQDR